MPFNLFPILWRLLLLKINELLNFHYFFRNFTCNSPVKIVILIAKGKRDKKRGLSQFFVYVWRAIKHETLVKNGIRAEKTLRRGGYNNGRKVSVLHV